MKAAAMMENVGIPVDIGTLTVLKNNWELIEDRLIRRVDADYGIYEGRSFKSERFAAWLAQKGIPWPQLESGRLALDDDTFHIMAARFPEIEPIRQVRVSLSQMRLADLAVGPDSRNRALLSAFGHEPGAISLVTRSSFSGRQSGYVR